MSGVAISVLMSCYNSEKTVQKSIESIISQSFQDYELIIIDDGSNGYIPVFRNDSVTSDGKKCFR